MKNMNIEEDFQKKMQEAAELYYRQSFETSVKVKGDTHFSQTYCVSNGGCTTTTTNYPKIFSLF